METYYTIYSVNFTIYSPDQEWKLDVPYNKYKSMEDNVVYFDCVGVIGMINDKGKVVHKANVNYAFAFNQPGGNDEETGGINAFQVKVLTPS